MNSKIMFSSATDNWSTPIGVFNKLNDEFHFDFDPCPLDPQPSKDGGQLKFLEQKTSKDGLNISWGKCSFVNPPYSEIKKWCKKSYDEWKKGKTVVMLIPSRTDTSYWHDYIMKATEIRFIRGRLKFGNSKENAPFPSCIVVFKI